MVYISKYISYKEATHTSTGLPNVPNDKQIAAMQLVAQKVFDKVREYVAQPLLVNSFFRSDKVNTAIGGAKTSQHCLGEAIDIDGYPQVSNSKVFHYIKDNLLFDQLIWEFGNKSEPDWVHVSLKANGNRKQVLRAEKINGKTKYTPYV